MDQQQSKTSARRSRPGRWSAVDTVILLLVLLAIAGVVYRVVMGMRHDHGASVKETYEVYFDVEETHKSVLEEVRGFDAVYLRENDMRLGYIGVYEDASAGEYRVAMTMTATENNRVTATGCMLSTGTVMSDGSLLVEGSGRNLTPGSTLELRTDRAILTVRITEIRKHS